jgi:flagella basal body P-ring formation protein FlgA
MPNIRSRRFCALTALLGLYATTLSLPVRAQQAVQPVHQAVNDFLQQQTAGLPGKVEITIEPIDSRNQLPPCAALETFLPPGTRAWGRINVGVRCDSPVTWTAYVAARVAVIGEYLVTARPLRSGQVVAPADLERRTGDLAAEAASTLTDMTQAVGHRVRYTVATGSTLRADMLRLPQAIRQGQSVKVLGSGAGFTVANEGRALNAAAAGDAVRVRLGNGQVISGTARADGTVELNF